jgi:hypothetical protein
MAGGKFIDPDALDLAATELSAIAPTASDIPPPVDDGSDDAARKNDGFLTATAGKNFSDQFKPVMNGIRDRIESHADAIGETADAWRDIDSAIAEGFNAREDDLGRSVI